nr:MAG: putative capsid protein [Narnaviridae sp.]
MPRDCTALLFELGVDEQSLCDSGIPYMSQRRSRSRSGVRVSTAPSASKQRRKRRARSKTRRQNPNYPERQLMSGNTRNPLMMSAEAAPVSVGYSYSSGKPNIRTNQRSCRVQHCELLVDEVQGAITFTRRRTLWVNPGLPSTFDWLSKQAQNWEQYRIHSLTLEWIPSVGADTPGDIVFTPSYDNTDRVPQNLRDAMNDYTSRIVPIWRRTQFGLDMPAMTTTGSRKFIRDGNIAGDMNLYDMCKLTISTVGQATNNEIMGRVLVHYDVEFFVPISDSSRSAHPSTMTFYYDSTGQTIWSGAGTRPSPYVMQFGGFDYNPLHIVYNSTSDQFTPPKGTYMVIAQTTLGASATGDWFGALSILGSGTIVVLPGGVSSNYGGGPVGPTGTRLLLFCRALVVCDGVGQVWLSLDMTHSNGTVTIEGRPSCTSISFQTV